MAMGSCTLQFVMNTTLFIILAVLSTARCGQICHVCDDIPIPENCPNVKECGPHETCSTESYLSPSGHILYKLGCKDTTLCKGFTINSIYKPVCSGCCSGNLCGVAMCGNNGYSTPRGPICFNCFYQMGQPSQCGKIQVCSRDEQCGVQKYDNGLYEVKCLANTSCTIPEAHTTCTSCCRDDVCNRNCRLASECQDIDVCPTLLETYPDLCSHPKLAIQCNGTCLGNDSCKGIPGPSSNPSLIGTKLPITAPITTPTDTPTTARWMTTSKTHFFPDGRLCADEQACEAVKITSAKYCSEPSLMIYCNQSCGLCASLGATGSNNANPCSSSPCLHGQCQPVSTSGIPTYTCKCDIGFMGALCENPDPCHRQPCVHGQCVVKDSIGGYQCNCDLGFSGPACDVSVVRDCQDVLDNKIGSTTNDNIYVIDIYNILNSKKLNVRCDFTSNLGWTVLMNRYSGHLNFDDKLSSDYAVGFGDVRGEFWMGLEYMHAITSDGRRYQLRIDFTHANDTKYYEIYDDFSVGPHNRFELTVGNSYGTAGDSLSGHSSFAFTTKDRDQDSNAARNCAEYIAGGWWFHDCADSCPTCKYFTPGTKNCQSMSWQTLGYCISLKAVSMKIRPL